MVDCGIVCGMEWVVSSLALVGCCIRPWYCVWSGMGCLFGGGIGG